MLDDFPTVVVAIVFSIPVPRRIRIVLLDVSTEAVAGHVGVCGDVCGVRDIVMLAKPCGLLRKDSLSPRKTSRSVVRPTRGTRRESRQWKTYRRLQRTSAATHRPDASPIRSHILVEYPHYLGDVAAGAALEELQDVSDARGLVFNASNAVVERRVLAVL